MRGRGFSYFWMDRPHEERRASSFVAGRHGSLGEPSMRLTIAHIAPLVALFAGVLILLMPRLLNYIVAIYLIVVGLVGLNGIYHFIR